jgi:hypothetical protein
MAMSTAEAGRKRWKGTTKKERTEQAQGAARIFWDSLTPEERSAEMKQRAAKRKRNKARKTKSL